MRPKGVNDLQVMWAVRDIPSFLITFDQKSILLLFLSVIGNREYCDYSLPELCEIFSIKRTRLKSIINFLDKRFLIIERSRLKGRSNTNQYRLDYRAILYCGNRSHADLLKNKQSSGDLFIEEIGRNLNVNGSESDLSIYKEIEDIHIKQERDLVDQKQSIEPSKGRATQVSEVADKAIKEMRKTLGYRH